VRAAWCQRKRQLLYGNETVSVIQRERIAIVYLWNFDVVPGLCNVAQLLSERGYAVDVFTCANPGFGTPALGKETHLTILWNGSTRPRILPQAPRYAQLWNSRPFDLPLRVGYRVVRRLRQASNTLRTVRHSIRISRVHRLSPYRCFIGVDPEGLMQAHSLARFIDVPFIYYSLELLLADEISNPTQQRLKRTEVSMSRSAAFVIIQDEKRGRLLADDNGIPPERFVFVPNAPLGPARRRRSGYWHERFGLSPDQRVVLHAGSVGQWTGIEQIVASVQSWPEHWVLVVHTPFDAGLSNDLQRLRELAVPGRVFLSPNPVSRQDYEMLVDGADIGVAFYVPTAGSTLTQENLRTIGLSSGKIAYYLHAGLPVILNKTPSISGLVEREGCGISVGRGQEIPGAIAQITHAYHEYTRQACAVFDRHFDPADGLREVIRRIDSLEGSAPYA